MSLDYRKRPRPVAAPAAESDPVAALRSIPGVRISGLPPQPAITLQHVGPQEAAMFRDLGIDPTQGVPMNFKQLHRAVLEAEAEQSLPPELQNRRLELGEPVKLQDLPPDAQERARETLRKFTELSRARRADDAANDVSSSSIAQMLRETAVDEQGRPAPALAVRPVQGPAVPTAPGVVATSVTVGPADVAPAPRPPSTRVDEPPPAPPEAGPDPGRCPRCNHDLSITEPFEPSEADVQLYVQHVLGAPRFLKDYDLFGGRVRLTARTLLSSEVQLLLLQVRADWQAGRVASYAEANTMAQRYNTVASLQRLEREGRVPLEVPPLEKIPFDPDPGHPGDTVLRALYEDFYGPDGVLGGESLARLIQARVVEFGLLVGRLEARAQDPGFWSGIGSPA